MRVTETESPCVFFWVGGCSGGHHPVEGQESVGVHPRGRDGGVGSVRGGGVPFPDAGLLRGHGRHARLLRLDQRIVVLQPVSPF